MLGQIGGAQVRIVRFRRVEGLVKGCGQTRQDGFGRKLARRAADDGKIGRPGGAELTFSRSQRGLRLRILRADGGDVRPGQLTDTKLGVGLVELGFQDFDVGLPDADYFGVSPHVDIGADHLLQDLLLDAAQRFPRGQHLGLGAAHPRAHAAAGVDRLAGGQGRVDAVALDA